MIIELSRGFSELNSAGWQKYHVAIENLITAHRSGWHILAPSRRTSASIIEGCKLSGTQQSVFESYILPKITTVSGQARSADCTLLCIPDDAPLHSERPNQIVAPLSTFADLRMVMPLRLITENSDSDGALLELICASVGRSLGYSMPICIDQIHGGGGTTASCYEKAFNENRPTLCVIDSDKRHPKGKIGSTAKAVLSHGAKNDLGLVQAFVLPVREAENLIPLSFLLEVYSGHAKIRDLLSEMHKFKNSHTCKSDVDKVFDFIDFKEGETCGSIAKLPDEFKVKVTSLAGALATVPLTKNELDDPKSEVVGVPAVSSNVLKATLSHIEKNRQLERLFAQKIKAAPFWPKFESIARYILSFSAAGQRLPV